MNKNRKKFWLIFPCVVIAMGLFVWFFQWLWNILLPDIIGVKTINYWQAFGILLLSKILFGGFNGAKEKFRRRQSIDGQNNWKQKFETQFCGTEEEREKFKEMWKQRFESKFCRQESETKESKI